MRQPNGKYLLLKDPMSPVVRLYSVPENAFDGDKDDNAKTAESDDEQHFSIISKLYILTVFFNCYFLGTLGSS